MLLPTFCLLAFRIFCTFHIGFSDHELVGEGLQDQISRETGYRNAEEFYMIYVAGCGGGDVEAIKLAQRNGVSLTVENDQGTPVFFLAAERGHTNVLRYLIDEAGMDPNQVDKYSTTALMVAAKHGQYEVVDFLSSHSKVDVNVVERKSGHTALSIAMMERHHGIAKLLCQRVQTHVRPIIAMVSDWVDGPYTLEACEQQYLADT